MSEVTSQDVFPKAGESGPAVAWVCTADDFGIGVATSRGIIAAHLNGPVTATSLMTNTGDHAKASIALLERAPRLEIGLHLVLTGGSKPLSRLARSGLVGRDGCFLSNGALWSRAWTGRIARSAVLDEVIAQAGEFRNLMGRAPCYVDGHHHAHQLPIIRNALAEVMNNGILPKIARRSLEPPGMLAAVKSQRLRRRAAHWLAKSARTTFSANQIRCNDYYVGMLGPVELNQPFPWMGFLNHAPTHPCTIEWVIHPGEPDQTLRGRDPYIDGRALELAALTDPARRHMWDAIRQGLTTKSALWGAMHVSP